MMPLYKIILAGILFLQVLNQEIIIQNFILEMIGQVGNVRVGACFSGSPMIFILNKFKYLFYKKQIISLLLNFAIYKEELSCFTCFG